MKKKQNPKKFLSKKIDSLLYKHWTVILLKFYKEKNMRPCVFGI